VIPVAANLTIVDWSGIVHAAWHERGPEGMAARVAGELLNLLKAPERDEGFPVERLVLAVDQGLDTHRHALTAHLDAPKRYKAHRTKKPHIFWALYDRLTGLASTLRIPTLAPADFAPQTWEADDAAATACRRARETGLSVLLVSRDKDWRQLVADEAPRVTWWSPTDQKILDAAGVIGEHGVPPELLGEWLALVGDASDNVPGADGIGPKGATVLLRAWGSLTNLLALTPLGPEEVTAGTKALEKRRRELAAARKKFQPTGALETAVADAAHEADLWKLLGKLHAHRAEVELSRQLVELRSDVPIELDLDEARVGGWDVREVRRVLDGLGCGWLGRQIDARPKMPRRGARGDGDRRASGRGADDPDRSGDRGRDPRHPDARAQQGAEHAQGRAEGARHEGGAVVLQCDARDGAASAHGGSGRGESEVAHLCGFSGCATAPAHVRARAIVAAIRTAADAIAATIAIRRLEAIPEGFREEHAEQAGAIFQKLTTGGQAA